jgi:hypothetical protein
MDDHPAFARDHGHGHADAIYLVVDQNDPLR